MISSKNPRIVEQKTGKTRILYLSSLQELIQDYTKDLEPEDYLFPSTKGGHLEGDAIDYLFTQEGIRSWKSERFDTQHTHGTGCTFSAVITAELAKGHTIEEAVNTAKRFITLAIKYTPEIGKGRGPVNHFAYQKVEGLDYE